MTIDTEHTAHRVDFGALGTVSVLGPTLGYITPVDDDDAAPCVMRGEIPPGGVVGLHSHADPETFVVLSGTTEALSVDPDGPRWIALRRGDVFHVPGNAKHAFRNPSHEPAVMIIATTARIGRFFREVAGLIEATGGSDPDAALWTFIGTAERYGHWLAGPKESAAVGLRPG
jgi:quercetin dioxygenase-like cupin family protein